MKQSHIQMPETVLKRFTDEKNFLYYIDCNSKKIGRGFAKSLYTEKGYYSERVEDWLSDTIETHLGVFIKFVAESNFETPQDINFDYKEFAFRYLYSLLARSPYMLDVVNDNSVFLQFYSATDRHDIVAHDTYEMLASRNAFKGIYVVSFVINETNEPFVLATSGICQCKIGIICPLTPQRALLFKRLEESDEENIIPLFNIDDEEMIKAINKKQYAQEIEYACKYVVSNSADCLREIMAE